MSPLLEIVAEREDAELAGLAGEFGWGRVRCAAQPGDDAAAVVALGSAPLPAAAVRVRWLDGPAGAPEPGTRTIAQAGEGLWRKAPWPVADSLFELRDPGGPALVVSADRERREFYSGAMTDKGLPVVSAGRLTSSGLAKAAVVVFPTEAGEPLPATAMAVLAARRVLVTGRCGPAFGLFPEVDWFTAEHRDDIIQYADSVLKYPHAFATPRALGARAAAPHRASLAYGRLMADLALEGARSPS
ncbi:MAG: hypothetical protein ABR581_05120 [Thermoleophilaceae bacterium]